MQRSLPETVLNCILTAVEPHTETSRFGSDEWRQTVLRWIANVLVVIVVWLVATLLVLAVLGAGLTVLSAGIVADTGSDGDEHLRRAGAV